MEDMSKGIVMWNIQGLNAKRPELTHLLEKYHPMAFCVQETKINKRSKQSYDIGDYKAEREDREGEIGHGGVAIYLHKNVPREHVRQIS